MAGSFGIRFKVGALRVALVLLFVSSLLVVVPGDSAAVVLGAIDQTVFSSNADHAAWNLYVRDLDGSSPYRLTNTNANDRDTVWSHGDPGADGGVYPSRDRVWS